MSQPLPLAVVWRDTLVDVRALLPLVWPVAAAFVLLPGVAIDLFGPPLPKTPAGLTPNVVLIELVLPALIGLIAQLTTIRLCLDRRRGVARSVGEALAAAVRTWPLAVVALVLGAVPIGCGLALIVPGLYLAGRLAPAVPLVLDGAAPLAALECAWGLTAGNGWRVIAVTLFLFGWFVALSAATGLVAAGVVAGLGAVGAATAAPVVAGTIDGGIAALFAVVNAVAAATVYRLLKA